MELFIGFISCFKGSHTNKASKFLFFGKDIQLHHNLYDDDVYSENKWGADCFIVWIAHILVIGAQRICLRTHIMAAEVSALGRC